MKIEEQIRKIKDTESPISNFSIFYKGKLRDEPVYEVDPNLLQFNVHNGRIGSEALEYAQTEGVSISEMNPDESNEIIAKWLWEKSESKNQATLIDIENKTQIKPGVITRDGIIVDGNRRFMLIRKLNKSGHNIRFKTIILDDAYSDGGNKEQHIKVLEASLQFGEDEKVEYGPIEKYLRVKDFTDKYIEVKSPTMNYKQLTEIMNITKGEKHTKQLYRISKLMFEYLEYIECNNMTSRLSNTEDLFINLEKVHSLYTNNNGKAGWNFSNDDVENYKTTGYDLIRWIYNVSNEKKAHLDPKKIRALYFKNSLDKTIFSNKSIWEEFHEKLYDLDEEPNVPEIEILVKNGMTQRDAAKRRDIVWADRVSDRLKGAIGKAASRIEDKEDTSKPHKFLEDALQKLENLIDEELFNSSGEINFNKNVLEYLSNEKTIKANYNIVNSIRKISESIKKELS
jgi:hypothetical protein